MDSIKRTSTKVRHIPRRSGVGARQVLAPRQPKTKYRSPASVLPPVCGAEHPDIEGLVCMSPIFNPLTGKPFRHRGAHRATVLSGIRLRWTDVEAAS